MKIILFMHVFVCVLKRSNTVWAESGTVKDGGIKKKKKKLTETKRKIKSG